MKIRSMSFKRKQAGLTTIQIAVGIAVVGLSIVGGMFLFKYIESAKVKNESAEIADLRSSSVNYATQHAGRYTGISMDIACSKDFFPQGRCSGTGAATTATNAWGGAITVATANLTGANTGVAWTYPGLTTSACIAEITDVWHHAARIDVGTTPVKTATTQALNDAAIIAACKAEADDATIVWTFGTN
jgi:hypothetical protein